MGVYYMLTCPDLHEKVDLGNEPWSYGIKQSALFCDDSPWAKILMWLAYKRWNGKRICVANDSDESESEGSYDDLTARDVTDEVVQDYNAHAWHTTPLKPRSERVL